MSIERMKAENERVKMKFASTWPVRTRSLGFGFAACCALAIALAKPASAQPAYPNKPLRLVVAFGPGGIADTIGRLVGQKLNDRFGQTIVVDGGVTTASA